jgi:mannose-6-phosphate isomerase-like protein (cupin superfamily)
VLPATVRIALDVVWWSIGAGVHVEPHSHANEQIVWMLKGKMEFRLRSEQRVCGAGDVVVIPGGTEHEAWSRYPWRKGLCRCEQGRDGGI